jgi:hypothetical protein
MLNKEVGVTEPVELFAVGVPEALPPYLLRSEIPRIVILRCKEAGYGAAHVSVWRAYRDILLRNGRAAAPIGVRELADEALVNFKSVPKYRDELLALDLLREVGRQRFSNLKGDDTPEITIPDWIEKENVVAVEEWLASRPSKHHLPQPDLKWKTRSVPKTVQNGRSVPKTVQNGRSSVPKTVQNDQFPVPNTEQNEALSVPKTVQARSIDRSIVNPPSVGEHVAHGETAHTPTDLPAPLFIDRVPIAPPSERALRAGLTVREQWSNARPSCPQASTELDRIEELTAWLDDAYATTYGTQGIGPYATIRAIREAIETNPQGFAHAPHVVPLVTHITERWVADKSWFSAKPRSRRRAAKPAVPPERTPAYQSEADAAERNAVDALLPVVRKVCGFSNTDLAPEIEADVWDTATRLHTQRQAEPVHVEQFAQWYARYDWRGKKDQAKPSLSDVRLFWDQAMAAIAAGALSVPTTPAPSASRAGKQTTPARRRGPVSATEGVQLDDTTIPHRAPRPRPAKETQS